ncbi:MAG: glycosyltransferase [Bacteroidia bacterium]|nr:glycosyltransferase [Bacteroidia bacterium]MDW8235543.1 glycosyltransferase [Bacteroidia bacterium]
MWRWRKYKSPQTLPGPLPPATLLIPVRNEALHLARCLDSLVAQAHLPEKILILDDGSEDKTPFIAQYYAQRYPFIVYQRLPAPISGKKAALQMGLQVVNSPIVITTDGDTVHEQDTIRKLLLPFCDEQVQAVGGWVKLRAEPTLLNALQRIEMAGILRLTAGSWSRDFPLTANGAILAYRRAAFEAVGGWGAAQIHPSGDDDILVQRIYARFGAKAISFSEAVVETEPAPSWRALIHQRLRWLSKRSAYPLPFTPWLLRGIALTQMSLIIALMLMPLLGATAWIVLGVIQARFAYKAIRWMRSPSPPLWQWIVVILIYPFYLTLIGLWAILHPSFEWKGRTYSTLS